MLSDPQSPGVDYRRLFESAPGCFLVLNRRFEIVAVTDAYLDATMRTRADLLGREIFDAFPDNPEDAHATGVATLRASLERVLATGRPDTMAVQKYDIERAETEGGGFEERYWSPINCPMLDERGAVDFIIHRVEDVTEYIRLLERGASDEGQSAATRHMAVDVLQRAREVQDANRELQELKTELESKLQERSEAADVARKQLESEIQARQRTVEKLERTEQQFRQAQKMESIGRLAGGIAHDFNNILSVIMSYADLVLDDLPAADRHRGALEEVLKAATRAADLTRQLLAFSRQQVLAPSVLDLNDVITNLRKILERIVGEDVELNFRLDPTSWRVLVDRSQVEQVILNLVVNARDAMPNGGTLTISTSTAHLDEEYTIDHVKMVPGDYSVLVVSDTGGGMDKATQARIYEPFFTTKDKGKGTGLGLSTVFGIVAQSGGAIWLYSEVGVGTTFKIYLPRGEGRTAEPAPVGAPSLASGSETILLVDDDESLRGVSKSILSRAGYRVIEARDPTEALRLCSDSSIPIDLLLTDVVMPKMNGRELAARVRDAQPHAKVLFMSGYTDDAILRHGILHSSEFFLQKPVTPRGMTSKVRAVLDSITPTAPA